MRKIAPVVLVLAILLGLFFLVACGGGSSSSSKTAQLRVANVDPFSATAGYDYLVAGSSFVTGLTFGNITGYSTLTSGAETIEVRNSGTSNDVVNISENLTGGSSYTFLAAGNGSGTAGLLLTDQNTAATSGNFSLRFVNLSTALSNFDVYVVPQTGDCNSYLNGVTANAFGLAFGNNSDYKTFPAGTYQLCITPNGSKTAVFVGGYSAYASGVVKTIVVDDIGGIQPLEIQTFTDVAAS